MMGSDPLISHFLRVITSYSIHYTKLYDAVGVVLNLLVYPKDPGFVGVQPHPMLFVALIIV